MLNTVNMGLVFLTGTLIVLLLAFFLWNLQQDKTCSLKRAVFYYDELKRIAEEERLRAGMEFSPLQSRQAVWLRAKACYALHKAGTPSKKQSPEKRKLLEDTYLMLLRACHQSRSGLREIQEEKGARLRAYISPIDNTLQTYSLSVPQSRDPSLPSPLLVSMHGHGWFAPYQGHPAPSYRGMFCLSPQGRGAADYKELGEIDVLAAIDEVKKDFNIDDNRIYLTGVSMGGTGAFHLATKYADRFAAINPIAGNADNRVWSSNWGWNRDFPGRNTPLRNWIQDGHTARAFYQNILNLPAFIIAGSADTVVHPGHSGNMADLLRKYGANVQYLEFPDCAHGGFPEETLSEALAWTCSWSRSTAPRSIFWKADQLKYGKAYWTRMEQFERPLESAFLYTTLDNSGIPHFNTKNLLAFSFRRPTELFTQADKMLLAVDNQSIELTSLPDTPEQWITLRKDPIHGWCDQKHLPPPGLRKKAGLEGPISEIFKAPFIVVVGTSSTDPAMNTAWQDEAAAFLNEWKRRNGGPCRIITDRDFLRGHDEMQHSYMADCNLLLFGGARDNSLSARLCRSIPISEIMELAIQETGDISPDAEDLGSFILYPNTELAPERLAVMLSANSPAAAYQMWGRFGNWFNWGVFDSKKYFDYAVFDSRSASPETMLLLGWYGTDWQVQSGKYFTGNKELRAALPPLIFPEITAPTDKPATLELSSLRPILIDQMRGAVAFGRGFFGEKLDSQNSIGMRAPCTLEYSLNGKFTNFTSNIRLINSPETNMCMAREKGEKIRFSIYGDGKLLAQKTLDWTNPEDTLTADITLVKSMKLEATPAGGPSWLHSGCAWLNPLLNR